MDTYSKSEETKFLHRARGVTEKEREIILNNVEKGVIDEGIFKWVLCPVWRNRLYHVTKINLIDDITLNKIFRYVLEGERIKG